MKRQMEFLRRQLKAGVLPHAYLFSGTDEKAKEEAVEFLLEGASGQDIFKIENDAISIDDIRFLKDNASRTPLAENPSSSLGARNIFLIRNIENLSWQAAPALLKLLEEPSSSTFILATTENLEKVLPTLRSRFSHLRFYGNAEGRTQGVHLSDNKPFKLPAKPPHEDKAEFTEFVRGALRHARMLLRRNPSPQNAERAGNILRAVNSLADPTINHRLVGEYIIMVLS